MNGFPLLGNEKPHQVPGLGEGGDRGFRGFHGAMVSGSGRGPEAIEPEDRTLLPILWVSTPPWSFLDMQTRCRIVARSLVVFRICRK